MMVGESTTCSSLVAFSLTHIFYATAFINITVLSPIKNPHPYIFPEQNILSKSAISFVIIFFLSHVVMDTSFRNNKILTNIFLPALPHRLLFILFRDNLQTHYYFHLDIKCDHYRASNRTTTSLLSVYFSPFSLVYFFHAHLHKLQLTCTFSIKSLYNVSFRNSYFVFP